MIIVEVFVEKSVFSTFRSGLGIKFLKCGGGNPNPETQYLTLFAGVFSCERLKIQQSSQRNKKKSSTRLLTFDLYLYLLIF